MQIPSTDRERAGEGSEGFPLLFVRSKNETGNGKVCPWKSGMQSSCQYDVMSRVSDFQNSEQKCSSKRRIKI